MVAISADRLRPDVAPLSQREIFSAGRSRVPPGRSSDHLPDLNRSLPQQLSNLRDNKVC